MARRPAIRPADLKAALAAMKEAGLQPTAFDIRPDGTQRWHFTPPALDDEDDLDRELQAFGAKHGYG